MQHSFSHTHDTLALTCDLPDKDLALSWFLPRWVSPEGLHSCHWGDTLDSTFDADLLLPPAGLFNAVEEDDGFWLSAEEAAWEMLVKAGPEWDVDMKLTWDWGKVVGGSESSLEFDEESSGLEFEKNKEKTMIIKS